MHLVMIFGPPAVGKMTVGHELMKLTGFRLFHNHMTVDPVLDIFEFGSPPFTRLVTSFRRMILEEAADSDLPGLVFTYVWALDDAGDRELVNKFSSIVTSRGGQVHFVELTATQQERLVRNATDFRLERKPSQRDVEASRSRLLDLDRRWLMNTGDQVAWSELMPGQECLRIDNTSLPADEVARRIVAAYDLPLLTTG